MVSEPPHASILASELSTAAERRSAAVQLPAVRRYVAVVTALALAVLGVGVATSGELTADDWAVGLPILLAAFVLTELYPLEVEVRMGTIAVPISEIPVVVSLLLFPLPVALFAATIAVVVRGFRLNQHRLAVGFNVSSVTLEVSLAYLVFHFGEAFGVPSLGAVFAGLVLSDLSCALVAIGLSWSMGDSRKELLRGHLAATTVTMAFVGPLIAVLGVQLLKSGSVGWILLVSTCTGFVVLYRAYSLVLRERQDMDSVHKIAEAVSTLDGSWAEVLELFRAQFNAGRAVLCIPDSEMIEACGRQLGPAEVELHRAADAVKLAARDEAKLLVASSPDPAIARDLEVRQASEVLVAPLGSGSGAGCIELYDRQNTIRGFGPRDVELLNTLARHVATAVDNRRLVAELSHAAYHDRLTDLRNRVGFAEKAAERLGGQEIDDEDDRGAVLLIGLGAVGRVNEALGLAWGNRLIENAARRVEEIVRRVVGHSTLLARMDGDTFAVVLPAADAGRCEAVTLELADELSKPYPLDDFSVEASVSIGIAWSPMPGHAMTVIDVEAMLRHADMAMQAARKEVQPAQTYHDGMGQRFLKRFQLVTQFRAAMNAGDVKIFEQPKLGLEHRDVVGAESLLRWTHPEFGAVNPEELVQVLEATGLMNDLTRFVLDRSLARCRIHLDAGYRIEPSVNVSVRNLLSPAFPEMVIEALQYHAVTPDMLTLEITETSVMGNAERTLPALRRLHEIGVQLSVDDFGTGYSSLAYLRRLPVDEIKIDKSFVMAMGTDLGDHAVVRAIIDLARSLDLRVVAEGVESDVVREQLAVMGCDVIQGYLVSRAVEPARFDRWLHARHFRMGDGQDSLTVGPS